MATSEQFNDSEMMLFFDTEMQKQIDSMRIEHEHDVVANRLWDAVESLEMELAVSRDPSAHENDFSALIEEVAEIIDALPQNDEADHSRTDDIRAFANHLWDEQITMIEQISLALGMQLYSSLPNSEKALIKKKLMARIIIKGDIQEQWLELADAALDGDALDLNSPQDFELITEALEIAANLDNAPEVQLYDKLLTLLGLPDLSQELSDDYDVDQMELLTYAARDIMEAALYNTERSQQPDRHSSINEVLHAYGLTGSVDLKVILKLSDEYADLKALQ